MATREENIKKINDGILDLRTGDLTAASAGHEYPILKEPDGSFQVFKDRHGMPIGAFDAAVYREYSLHLSPGSVLFVYTDGLAEATDRRNVQFGPGQPHDPHRQRCRPHQIIGEARREDHRTGDDRHAGERHAQDQQRRKDAGRSGQGIAVHVVRCRHPDLGEQRGHR